MRERVRFSARLGFSIIGPMINAEYADFDDIGMKGFMVPVLINLRFGFRMMH